MATAPVGLHAGRQFPSSFQFSGNGRALLDAAPLETLLDGIGGLGDVSACHSPVPILVRIPGQRHLVDGDGSESQGCHPIHLPNRDDAFIGELQGSKLPGHLPQLLDTGQERSRQDFMEMSRHHLQDPKRMFQRHQCGWVTMRTDDDPVEVLGRDLRVLVGARAA